MEEKNNKVWIVAVDMGYGHQRTAYPLRNFAFGGKIVNANNYNGIPVVDKIGILVGILTKYDLIVKKESIRDDTKVKDVMNNDPLVLMENMTVDDAIRAFSEHHKVDPIPVVTMDRKVIGIITRYDMVKLFREYGLGSEAKQGAAIAGKGSSILPIVVLLILAIAAGALYYLGYLGNLGSSF